MVGHPNRTFLRTHDVAESSQVAIDERSALVEAARMTMHGTMMVMQEERCREPIAPTDPELQWLDDDILHILDHETVL